ncbi:hypothetical protein RHMOL_Rhmol04G0095700 [Rhododendron molle]|uniref:Uncharacterized protein n=1 Tax=Rhododendron molle TaxID=49168 RepID=A0ACC0P0U0_RHOML|nr:hypothetical protein RHMOL_Rhmol04G0095700 [Rhododendron molle]
MRVLFGFDQKQASHTSKRNPSQLIAAQQQKITAAPKKAPAAAGLPPLSRLRCLPSLSLRLRLEMTLDEYEKVLEEKRKALLALKTEERKVSMDKDLVSMQLLSSKKSKEEIFVKLGSDKDKRKDAAEKEEKAKKRAGDVLFIQCICNQLLIHGKTIRVDLARKEGMMMHVWLVLLLRLLRCLLDLSWYGSLRSELHVYALVFVQELN